MSEVYIVSNQDGYFASKKKEWLDGREPRLLFRSPHKDEAVNIVFELSSKDITVRAAAITTKLDGHKNPIVEVTVPLVEIEPEFAIDESNKQAQTLEAIVTDKQAPHELSASERLSKMAAKLRQQEA